MRRRRSVENGYVADALLAPCHIICVASKAFSLSPTANVVNLIMLSKVKNIAVIEVEGLLKEPNRRKHWFHPFNADK